MVCILGVLAEVDPHPVDLAGEPAGVGGVIRADGGAGLITDIGGLVISTDRFRILMWGISRDWFFYTPVPGQRQWSLFRRFITDIVEADLQHLAFELICGVPRLSGEPRRTESYNPRQVGPLFCSSGTTC